MGASSRFFSTPCEELAPMGRSYVNADYRLIQKQL